jgi:hypothetical protein
MSSKKWRKKNKHFRGDSGADAQYISLLARFKRCWPAPHLVLPAQTLLRSCYRCPVQWNPSFAILYKYTVLSIAIPHTLPCHAQRTTPALEQPGRRWLHNGMLAGQRRRRHGMARSPSKRYWHIAAAYDAPHLMHEGHRFGSSALPFPASRTCFDDGVGFHADRYIVCVNGGRLIAIAHDACGRPAIFVVRAVEPFVDCMFSS